MGRPTKLTPQRIEAIAELVRNGNYLVVAAEAAGVSDAAVYKWLERGSRDEERDQDSLYFQFREAIQRAQAEAEQVLVSAIEKAATGYTRKSTKTRRYQDPETGVEVVETTVEEAQVYDWRAAAWLLQQRHRSRWSANPPKETESEEEHVKVLVIGQAPPIQPASSEPEAPPPESMDEILGV
jgi:transposase